MCGCVYTIGISVSRAASATHQLADRLYVALVGLAALPQRAHARLAAPRQARLRPFVQVAQCGQAPLAAKRRHLEGGGN